MSTFPKNSRIPSGAPPADPGSAAPNVALLPWGNVIEDYLDAIGVSLEAFCREMSGGWLFGYIEALRRAGVRTTVFCVSARVRGVTRFTNEPTGASICVLPASRGYRLLRRGMANPYGWTLEEVMGREHASRPRRALVRALRDLCFYRATPLTRLARELRRERCAAILCQEYEYARFDVCVLLGRLLRLPVFATFQGGDWQMSRLERYFRPRALRGSAGLIIASGTEADRVRAAYDLPGGKVLPIFNPLDLSVWHPAGRDARERLGIPATARVAIWHGRVDIHRKGLDVLLAAWERLRRNAAAAGGDWRLVLVGSGADAARLRALLAEPALAGVHWLDEYTLDRAAMRGYLSAADVYAFPSRHEGFPVAPLEAMACGLPIVAAAAPGVPDILPEGERSGGTIVPVGDVAALANALERYFRDPDLARETGSYARRRAESAFSLDAVGAQLRAALLDAGTDHEPRDSGGES